MNGETSSSHKLMRCIKAPIKMLCRARDLYVRSLSQCAGSVHWGAAIGCPASVVYTLPKSFSTNSFRPNDSDDFQELLRAVSLREKEKKLALEETAKAPTRTTVATKLRSEKLQPKSLSVGMGRIDEDKPCFFQDDDDFKVGSIEASVYPRCRSYGEGKGGRTLS